MRDVNRAPRHRYIEISRLDNGVLLGVQGAHTMAIHQQVSYIIAVGQPSRRAIVTGGEDASVAYDDGSNMGAVASAASCHMQSNAHEVFIPAWSFSHDYPPLKCTTHFKRPKVVSASHMG